MLLGGSTCLNLLTLGDQPCGQKWLNPGSKQTNAVCFEARWDAASQLTISSTFPQTSRLCCISHRLLTVDPAIEIGTSIMLCPSGMKGNYRGVLRAPDGTLSSGRINDLKTECTSQLKHQGLSISPEADWVQIEVAKTQTSNKETEVKSPQTLLIWPAEYVICRDANSAGRARNFKGSRSSDIIDPLARVESWFAGRAARAKEVEAAQKEVQIEVQQQSAQLEASDIDALSEVDSPIIRDIMSQDVSGIYPTPPDGLISNGLETSASNNQPEESPNDLGLDQGAESFGVPGYEDGANQDLFGDMDMDILSGNDLTDADFNFFDDPGLENERSRDAMQDAPNEMSLDEQQTVNSQGLIGADSAKVEGKVFQESSELDASLEGEPKIEEFAPFAHDSTKSPQNEILETAEGVADLETPGIHEVELREDPVAKFVLEQSLPNNGLGLLKRGSFNPMSLSNLHFDSKYGAAGRFGYPPAILETLDQTKKEQQNEQQIPKLGVKPISTASPDSEIDIGIFPLANVISFTNSKRRRRFGRWPLLENSWIRRQRRPPRHE